MTVLLVKERQKKKKMEAGAEVSKEECAGWADAARLLGSEDLTVLVAREFSGGDGRSRAVIVPTDSMGRNDLPLWSFEWGPRNYSLPYYAPALIAMLDRKAAEIGNWRGTSATMTNLSRKVVFPRYQGKNFERWMDLAEKTSGTREIPRMTLIMPAAAPGVWPASRDGVRLSWRETPAAGIEEVGERLRRAFRTPGSRGRELEESALRLAADLKMPPEDFAEEYEKARQASMQKEI